MKLKRRFRGMLALIVVLSLVLGQASDIKGEAKTTAVKKVTLNKSQYVLAKGGKVKLKAAVTPSKAKKSSKVTWKSSNGKVVSVTKDGVVKALKKSGKATITATAGKKKATCKITIGKAVKKIAAKNITVKVGGKQKIKTTLTPSKPTVKTLVYTSSNKKVAAVDKKGTVKGIKAGTAKITITAKDCMNVKKTIKVTVKGADAIASGEPAASVPGVVPAATLAPAAVTVAPVIPATVQPVVTVKPAETAKPSAETAKPTEDVPPFTLEAEDESITLNIGNDEIPEIRFRGKRPDDTDLTWESEEDTVVSVISSTGKLHALTPGTSKVTVTSQADPRVSVSIEVTVSDSGVTKETAKSVDELTALLEEGKADFITLETDEEEIEIPEGTYSDVTLVIDAPKATVENSASFKQILVKELAKDTWVERVGNQLFFNERDVHLIADEESNPSVAILGGSESVTVENNGNMKELLIAKAAQVMVKGDAIAKRFDVDNIAGGKITTYLPLDIYSTTTFGLVIGENGEQTAVRVSNENDIPTISGLGTISITIDSTRESRTVIAENDGSIELPATNLSGTIVPEKEGKVKATVYLVYYTMEMTGDNVSVYLSKEKTKKTETADDGTYSFKDVSLGNYVVVVEAEGYSLITQNIFIGSSYKDRDYVVDDIYLIDADGEPGSIHGSLVDVEALDGKPSTYGLTVTLRKGMNNITSDAIDTTEPDDDGTFTFKNLTPGQYTIAVRDSSELRGSDSGNYYGFTYVNVAVLSGAAVNKVIYLSKVFASDKVRFVLTWGDKDSGASEDLDLYVYGPDAFEGSEFDMHFHESSYYNYTSSHSLEDGKSVTQANLDVDDKEYEGPETITIHTVLPGRYKVFVRDYTNSGGGNNLFKSAPVIRVYAGTALKDTITMTAEEGGVWYAGDYLTETGHFAIVDEAGTEDPNTMVKAKIGTVFNKLEQFEVTDSKAFASYQAVIDEVKENYIAEKDAEKLAGYLEQMEKVLKDIEDALVMKGLSGKGFTRSFSGYLSSHSISSISGTEETPEDFDVEMKNKDGKLLKLSKTTDGSWGYWFKIVNTAVGISTKYFFSYYKQSTSSYTPVETKKYWVRSIDDPDNDGYKSSVNYSNAYIGGYNEKPGRNLDIKYYDGVELESMEYREDTDDLEAWKEKYEKSNRADIVLHLKRMKTGDTEDAEETEETKETEEKLDYTIKYIPLGAELIRIDDPNNTYTSQHASTSYYSWYSEDKEFTYTLVGENLELGETWIPVVTEGAEYKIEEMSDEDKEKGMSYDCKIIVTRSNGAKTTYLLYYYVDTSDATLLGLRDPNNMFTNYSESSSYYGKNTYSISLSGMNSKLGDSLVPYTRAGAEAKIEYATSSESFDGVSSDAKITVTAKSGVQRIYYVGYTKADKMIHLRALDSESNTLYKVYTYGSTIYVTGEKPELGSDVKVTAGAGYTGEYDAESAKVLVKKADTGSVEESYSITYTQDINSMQLKTVKNTANTIKSCVVSNSSYNNSDTSEKYYLVSLIGDNAECPKDLTAKVSYGATYEITYAAAVEDWKYKDFQASIVVTNGNGVSVLYLVQYEQDDTGATVKDITDTGNKYGYKRIDASTSSIYLKNYEDGNRYEMVYPIYVTGDNASLGSSYSLTIQDGEDAKTSVLTPEDEGWNYSTKDVELSWKAGDVYREGRFTYAARVEVTAKNGAKRIYVIAYMQDDSGAMVSGITDEKNTYAAVKVETSTRTWNLKERVDGSYYERAYPIYVAGNNDSLGSSYKLTLPEGASTSVITSADEGWNYSYDTISASVDDKKGNRYSGTFTCAARVEVTAKNGTKRVYVICYMQDSSGAAVSEITTSGIIASNIGNAPVTMYCYDKESETSYSEDAYIIYVFGDSTELGECELKYPEGASVISTISSSDAAWKYTYKTTPRSWYDADSKCYNGTFTYEKRVEVKAKNGAVRVYVIAYLQDDSGTVATEIAPKDKTAEYVYSQIMSGMYQTVSLPYLEPEGDETSITVYPIYVVGDAETLGEFELTLPEGSKVNSTILSSSAGWKYQKETGNTVSWTVDSVYYYSYFRYEALVEVAAANGAKRQYVIAYLQDDRGALVTGISDTKNTYTNTDVRSSNAQVFSLKDSTEKEKVYTICVLGKNETLGNTFALEMPEGSKITKTTQSTDADWPYTNTTIYFSGYGSIPIAARLEVTAKNGATRVYVVGYKQDTTE